MKAVVAQNNTAQLVDRPVPEPRPDQILVKVNYVALNPTDWKHYTYGIAGSNCILGCDYSGTVHSIGSAVTKPFKVGDRICGVAHGGNKSNPDDGVFAEYAVVKGDLQMRVPEGLSMEEASTFPLGAITCGQNLFQSALKLNSPESPAKGSEFVLVYGGSTATGSLAVQYARLAGYKVVTTCSERHFGWMRELGAEPFDYRDDKCAAKIREFTGDKLRYACDTISLPESAAICAAALSSASEGCRYGSLLPVDFPRKDVQSVGTLMYTIFDEEFEFLGNTVRRSTEDFEYARGFFEMTERLLGEGRLKTHKEEVKEGGLEGVIEGMISNCIND